jgi:hypothetical protein
VLGVHVPLECAFLGVNANAHTRECHTKQRRKNHPSHRMPLMKK